jgi:hypothetical protein
VRRIGYDQPLKEIVTRFSGGHGGGDPVLGRELKDVMLNDAAPATTLDDGLASAITCFGIDQALETGQVVDMAPLWQEAGIPLR